MPAVGLIELLIGPRPSTSLLMLLSAGSAKRVQLSRPTRKAPFGFRMSRDDTSCRARGLISYDVDLRLRSGH